MKSQGGLHPPFMVHAWETVLVEVVERIDDPLKRSGFAWSLAGSTATALQGCAVLPHDIDLLLRERSGVDALVALMQKYAPRVCDAVAGSEDWVSSTAKPTMDELDAEGFRWYWGRWLIQGFKVEGAHIRASDGAQGAEPGIWENGPEIWTLQRRVRFKGHRIRVPPLEVQLATCARRGLTDRVEAITRVLIRDGANPELLKRSLSDPPVRALLDRFPVGD